MKLIYITLFILIFFFASTLIFYAYSTNSLVHAQEEQGVEEVFIWPVGIPESVKVMAQPIYVAGSTSYSVTGGDLWQYQVGLRGAGGQFVNALPVGGYWVDIQPLLPPSLFWDHPVTGTKPQTILPGIIVYVADPTAHQVMPKFVYDSTGNEYPYGSFPSTPPVSASTAPSPSVSTTPPVSKKPVRIIISQSQRDDQILDRTTSNSSANINLNFNESGIAIIRFQIDYDSGAPEVYYVQYKLKKTSGAEASSTSAPEPIGLIDFNGDGVINAFDSIDYDRLKLGL